ncbi:uncharacterized protein LOC131229058 isoform X2 [Magnolia sinica]|uniref:uncharacterized protein LOC131229058 isoform X2 n=1 Tax=Magnolia sinica TaxID=86752 RepID=UPI0026588A90|nr:uncharacterized protein LOC131229058 isoform X2 [Magnolia sinica]
MLQVTRSSDGAAKEHEHRVKGFEIFVGGLARSVTEGMIREVFCSCGEILEVRMIKDQNGTSKGFCFVRFATKEAAFKARKEKDGSMLEGKKLGVAQSANQDSLFLGNLRKDWSFEEFNKMVHQAFQDVVSTELAMPSKTGDSADGKRQNRGFAFVQFSSHGAAARAHRIGSKPDFVLGDKWHPIVDWAEKEPEIDPEELAKIKVAFVGNLPKNTDEGYLKKLFEPFGKLEKVALSRKGHFPVGFIHFAKRSVSVARPAEKDRKRARDESQSKTANKSGTRATSSKEIYARDYSDNHKPKAPQLNYSREVPDAIDPYEKAVASLPSPLTERLLQIFRLGIATRYDIDIHLITSLKELPLSAATLVLDQFMLTCADGYDKGRDLAGLIARHQIYNVGLNRKPLHLPGRTRDFEPRESELPSLPGRKHVPAFDPVVSRSAGTALARYESYTPSPRLHPYSSSFRDDPLPHRAGIGKVGEMGSLSSYRTPPPLGHGSMGSESRHGPAADRPPERPQMKFDPFTGEPYKFDPFTGEPIRLESFPQHSRSHF